MNLSFTLIENDKGRQFFFMQPPPFTWWTNGRHDRWMDTFAGEWTYYAFRLFVWLLWICNLVACRYPFIVLQCCVCLCHSVTYSCPLAVDSLCDRDDDNETKERKRNTNTHTKSNITGFVWDLCYTFAFGYRSTCGVSKVHIIIS